MQGCGRSGTGGRSFAFVTTVIPDRECNERIRNLEITSARFPDVQLHI
jgi:hypothetical protein